MRSELGQLLNVETMAATGPAAAGAPSCISVEHGCSTNMFDCLVHLWEWFDPQEPQSSFQMENKKSAPATQQPLTQQHIMAHHVHPGEQMYSHQHPQLSSVLSSPQSGQLQPNGVMHQLLQSQYHSNIDARSPLLENRHELYGTGHNHDYARHYGANENFNYPISPTRSERTDLHTDHNVNHELLQNMPKGYNAEVYQDYLKRNPPKDTNQIYQNHQPMHRPNAEQYGSKPYLPYSNRIGSQSNTEMLRRQYNEIQQMKLQQQMHYQSQAQIHQQQKFAERQLLLQQIHGVQPPPNLQNSIYSDGSYRDIERYCSKNDFKEYNSADIQKDVDRYAKNNEFKELEKQTRQYQQEPQWQSNQQTDYREVERYRIQSESKEKSQSPPSNYTNQQKNNVGIVSPMKSSESSSPSIKSPSSESRRSSSGNQALRSPIAQRIPTAPVTTSGILYKQGSDGLKVWRKRWFVLSEYCLFYYKSQEEEKLLGSVLLPSYKVSACSQEDKVLRKYAFKLEHANMRTYVLAALDQEAMMKWVKALTMAALMEKPNEHQLKQGDRAAAKTEDGDEVPGPTYANAPPKPRRSNEGYNSPSPEVYDPNYDLLKKPSSHYGQTSHTRYQDQTTYQTNQNTESIYTRNPQSPPTIHPPQYPTKRPYDTHNLSLPLTNSANERQDNSQPGTSVIYRNNPQSPYFENRARNQQTQQRTQEKPQDQIYERQAKRSSNPFLQDTSPPSDLPSETDYTQFADTSNATFKAAMDQERTKVQNEARPEPRTVTNVEPNVYNNRDTYGELAARQGRPGNATVNERLLIERRTPDAYGRSTAMSSYNNRSTNGDYEDVYADKEYGRTCTKQPTNPTQSRDSVSLSGQQQGQDITPSYPQEKTFSGPSVLRRKKMQASGIQPPVPRPHSADFLEYESQNNLLNKTMPSQTVYDQPRQPQRPKSSLDINSFYDPSSDRYYSEESYAEKMRQSAQYLQQQALGPRNIQIPLDRYKSGLAEKQLHSPYTHSVNNNYEIEFGAKKASKDNVSFNSKVSDQETINSNWTLKEKDLAAQKEFLNRSGSVMSDSSNISNYAKDMMSRFDPTSDGFIRSASARLPTNAGEKEGEKKVQQREESMKRLLEWKQRMLQSPLTRKSTPATISLARSLNHSRQSLRSDQFKPKIYANASYNSYSSDDEEETPGTELLKQRELQAGRSQSERQTSPIILQPATPHASDNANTVDETDDHTHHRHSSNKVIYENMCSHPAEPSSEIVESMYENTCFNSSNQSNEISQECDEDGYETNDSEAASENQVEYTDDDLDEVLQDVNDSEYNNTMDKEADSVSTDNKEENGVETPPVQSTEDHYLPMSPRKTSAIEPAHKVILENMSVFDQTLPLGHEDNPYVVMNVGNEDEDDMQTYEIVCVNNGKVEPVYMELSNLYSSSEVTYDNSPQKSLTDTASNFADTKEHTLKRANKSEKQSKALNSDLKCIEKANYKNRSDCSDADDEASKDISLDAPFSRFSISDTFRPASYYLGGSQNILDIQSSSDSEILPLPPIPSTSPPCEELSDEALSKYVLDKLDQSNMSQDNSILKMLTNESQKINTVKRKTTSLMIYGSRTSIHDTLSRGEKIRNSRASLNETRKMNEMQANLLSNSILEHYTSSRSIETDSLMSYNADRGSSRLSLESDISSKFDMVPSNYSSEAVSLNGSDSIEIRHPSSYRDMESMIKRRPLSDDSVFEFSDLNLPVAREAASNVDLDSYLDNLQPNSNHRHSGQFSLNASAQDDNVFYKDNVARAEHLKTVTHTRCSSMPVAHTVKTSTLEKKKVVRQRNIAEQTSGYTGSQSSCSSAGFGKSPISYYRKNYDEEKFFSKNLNKYDMSDKIKEFEEEKHTIGTRIETHPSSSTSTGFHSRDSSTEQSAPYYYSDLSSQEHINLLPTSHYLKNTNLYRKLNNQRRRGPLHKKNDISHIHNPIHNNNKAYMTEQPFELAAAARSVSVEFLSATDKDPEIDMKNIYESTRGIDSKIPESISLLPGFGCKSNSNSNTESSSPESTSKHTIDTCRHIPIKPSSTSMSSPCSENSSNTVYYDAEADAYAYENLICQGDKLWDEDALWRDNLRRVSHRHARSMDDLDTLPAESSLSTQIGVDVSAMNSIKRIKKQKKVTRSVVYVNDIQNHMPIHRDMLEPLQNIATDAKVDDNDVYVSLAKSAEVSLEQSDEGVYEQLAIESSDNSVVAPTFPATTIERRRRKFEIDRENLRQWDLMSSGLIKARVAGVRGPGVSAGTGEALCSTDSGADSASNEASMTNKVNIESGVNSSLNQEAMSKKAFLGSNTSIGRANRDNNIPVRAVSPRVRWVEEKQINDQYGSQQMMTSQQNIHSMMANEECWTNGRSPSRASQQPIRAVSPRIRRNTENDDMPREQHHGSTHAMDQLGDVPTAGELLGRTHEELVLLLIQLRRRHAATHRAIEQSCAQINSMEECLSSLKAMEREESLQRLDQLKMQLMELEHQYEKSKPLVQLVDNMVKLGSLYNRPGSTVERLERNQRLRHKVLAEHALEQRRWLESAAAGQPLETEAARARVAELWALEQELADEASILHGLKTDKDTIESLLTGVRTKYSTMQVNEPRGEDLEAELARVHAMLALNSKKLEQTVADNARLERELLQLRRALHMQRQSVPAPATNMLEDEVSRVQQLVSALQRQRQELSRAVRHLTQQSRDLQTTQHSLPGSKRRPPPPNISSWQETNLDTGHTIDHGQPEYEYDMKTVLPPGHYEPSRMEMPLYVDTRGAVVDVLSPMTSEEMQNNGFANLSNVEKQEIKTVRIVKRESERRQRDRERSLQPMSDWPNNITANLDQFLEEEYLPSNYKQQLTQNHQRPTDFSKFEEYYSRPQIIEPPNYLKLNKDMTSSMEMSPKFPSSPSLSNYDYSRDISSLSSSYNKNYDRNGYDRTISISTQYLNSPTDSSRTLTNDPMSKTSSIGSLTRSHMELSPIFKSEAAKQIITEMSGDPTKNGSLHRRQMPKEKKRRNTAPHHLSAKTLNELPKDLLNQDKLGRSLDDADMERVLRAPPDVVRSALVPQRYAENTIDQLLAAPQKILIPERYIPEKPPELSPEEQQKRLEKVESIKKMLSGSSADPSKSPDGEDKKQREHLLQMNQILAKQVTEMSKIIAVKALEELPLHEREIDSDDRSPDVELPIYQQRDNFFT